MFSQRAFALQIKIKQFSPVGQHEISVIIELTLDGRLGRSSLKNNATALHLKNAASARTWPT